MPVPQGLNIKNRQDACATKLKSSCGVGILPAVKKLLKISQTHQKNQIPKPVSPNRPFLWQPEKQQTQFYNFW
jgi:hypothetical protein